MVQLLQFVDRAFQAWLSDVSFFQEELSAEVRPLHLLAIPNCELLAPTEHDILGDFNTKWSQSQKQDAGLTLLGDSLDSHSADVTTPSILDLLIIDVKLDVLACFAVTHIDFLHNRI